MFWPYLEFVTNIPHLFFIVVVFFSFSCSELDFEDVLSLQSHDVAYIFSNSPNNFDIAWFISRSKLLGSSRVPSALLNHR